MKLSLEKTSQYQYKEKKEAQLTARYATFSIEGLE
jgi:hypothetical protein